MSDNLASEGSRKFKRMPEHGVLGGVCAGLAYSLGFQTWLVRLAWVVVVFFGGFGILLYILMWMMAPTWGG